MKEHTTLLRDFKASLNVKLLDNFVCVCVKATMRL